MEGLLGFALALDRLPNAKYFRLRFRGLLLVVVVLFVDQTRRDKERSDTW